MMTTTSSDMSLEPRHYANVLLRRKGVIVLAVLTVFCSALVALSFMSNEYEAIVTMRFNEPQTPLPEVSTQGPSGAREGARLEAFAARIQSKPFLERVVRMLPLTENPKVRAAAEEIQRKNPQLPVDAIALRLVVEGIVSRLRFGKKGTGIYSVVVTDSDPTTAQLLAQYIGEFYKDDTKMQTDAQFQQTIAFLEEQLRLQEEKLKDAEQRLEQYRGSQIKELLSRSTIRAENLDAAKYLQRRVRQVAEEAEDRVRVRKAGLANAGITQAAADATLSATEFNQYAEQLKESLAGRIDDRLSVVTLPRVEQSLWPPADVEYNDLRQKLGSRVAEKVRSTRPQANAAAANAHVAYVFSRIDAEAQSEVARDLDRRIQDYTEQAQDEPAQEFELRKLDQDVQNKRALLEVFRSTETRNRILQAVQNASLGQQVDILDPPQLPLSPSRPNRMKILLGALLLGTMFGLGLAFLSEITDPTVRTLADIQRVAPEPILCTTPLLSKLQPRVRGLRRFWLPAAVSAVVLLTAAFFVARLMVREDQVPGARPATAASEAQTGG